MFVATTASVRMKQHYRFNIIGSTRQGFLLVSRGSTTTTTNNNNNHINNDDNNNNNNNDDITTTTMIIVILTTSLRPISLLTLWISEGSTQDLNSKGWNSQAHGGFPGKFESSNVSRDNVRREIGRIS